MKKGIFQCSALAAAIILSGCNSDSSDDNNKVDYGAKAVSYLVEIADETQGIGDREASTQKEIQTGNWIYDKLTGFGFDVNAQPFVYEKKGKTYFSNNYIVEKKGKVDKTIILAAHYDSTGVDHGSLGATDNGAGLAAAIAIAEKLQQTELPFNVRILYPGAEENGLNGSLYYVKDALANDKLKNVIGMINYDTVGGGDIVYVHAAHSDYAEYKRTCESLGLTETDYSFDTKMREAMLKASVDVNGEADKYVIHPTFPGYPEGETGSWSDHAGFACAGIPIAYVEATNFNINGADGYDGYSQTTNPAMWDCYDADNKTACNRAEEKKWGKIWHTEFDRIDKLEEAFPGRVDKQLSDNVNIVLELLTSDKYIQVK
ncbi:M28 family metallopeptidase [Photobacterium sanguinicancri]|uniref:Zn-dependent exopeptidase M28 n=1 Tax=Photobacterium sanguinicancri TaxID=875932 RepID=A0ABX4FRD0_9GAMM|nr:M20/M25/M40 family metallo-hydrolase [Photobacterium sanguinicancri]OZS41457.1 Zn-dependent exopeptidase M28 [Photobacterium sanguinicancri]